MPYYIYRKADFVFMPGQSAAPDAQGRVPQITDDDAYGVVELASDPDVERERCDLTVPAHRRAATAQELDTEKTARIAQRVAREAQTLVVRAVARQLYEEIRAAIPTYRRTWPEVLSAIEVRIKANL